MSRGAVWRDTQAFLSEMLALLEDGAGKVGIWFDSNPSTV